MTIDPHLDLSAAANERADEVRVALAKSIRAMRTSSDSTLNDVIRLHEVLSILSQLEQEPGSGGPD